jgi:ubiquinone/menaquinone biosynthesis C-methylase UbiE
MDLGAGTGKFTPLLVATGASVVAVEPVDAMRAQLLSNLPTVTALAASAQALPLADASVDAVLCAQAFHWFATPAALREIGRVLKVGGKLGLVWNVRDESVDWVAAITRIIAPYEGDTPRFHTGEWRRLFPSERFSQLGGNRAELSPPGARPTGDRRAGPVGELYRGVAGNGPQVRGAKPG